MNLEAILLLLYALDNGCSWGAKLGS